MGETKYDRKIKGCRIQISGSRLHCFNVVTWNRLKSSRPQSIHDKIAKYYLIALRIVQEFNLHQFPKREQIQSRYSNLGNYSCFSNLFYVPLAWLNNPFQHIVTAYVRDWWLVPLHACHALVSNSPPLLFIFVSLFLTTFPSPGTPWLNTPWFNACSQN